MNQAKAPTQDEFSVCQFFRDGSYEYVRRFISAEEAVRIAKHYTSSVGAKLGTTTRVIITDSGDCTCFEWTYGKGVIFGLSGQKPPKGAP